MVTTLPTTKPASTAPRSSEIGQVRTQFDAFPHQMIGGSFYNCVPIEGNESRAWFGTSGVDDVGSLVGRRADRYRRSGWCAGPLHIVLNWTEELKQIIARGGVR